MSEPRTYDIGGDDAALLGRVRKLMDKATATTNPHEADAFSRKAAELVARHRLDPSRLAATCDAGALAVREVAVGRGAYVRARLALLTAIADAHDARVVFGSTPTGTVAYVAGVRGDLDVIEVMYESLHTQAASQMAAIRRSTAAATQRFRRSFLFGYADRVGQLLSETRSDVEQHSPDGGGARAALALRERRDRIEVFASEVFGRVRTARAPTGAQVGAWQAGSAAADRADVGRTRLRARRAIGPGA